MLVYLLNPHNVWTNANELDQVMGKSRHVNAASGPGYLAYGKKFPRASDMVLVRVPGTILPMISPGSPSGVVRSLPLLSRPHFHRIPFMIPGESIASLNRPQATMSTVAVTDPRRQWTTSTWMKRPI
jgi:hypothetical protein